MEKEDIERATAEIDDAFESRWLPLMAGIGRVAAVWAKLEFTINEMIWDLANLDINCGACITSQLTSPISRMRALIALVRLLGGKDKLIGDLNKFSGRIDGLARRRNRIVHDPWAYSVDKKTFVRLEITADRKLVFEDKKAELEELTRVLDDIIHATVDFLKMEHRIMAELPAWPRTQYWQSWEKRGDEVRPTLSSEPKAPPPPQPPLQASPSYYAQLKTKDSFPLWFWACQT
jgi:hypothetical protein